MRPANTEWAFGSGFVESLPQVSFEPLQAKGRGALSRCSIATGEIIAQDNPLASTQLLTNDKRVLACGQCLRLLGKVSTQLNFLAGAPEESEESSSIETTNDFFLSNVVPCRNLCGTVRYCSTWCEETAFAAHHELLCPGHVAENYGHNSVLDFIAHASEENECFHLAGKVIASLLSSRSLAERQEKLSSVLRLCAAGPWWELVAVPDDVPETKREAYRSKVKAAALRSLSLLKEALRHAAPPEDIAFVFDPEFYGHLLGAILQNSVAVHLPNPARQYLEAQLESGNEEAVRSLAGLARKIVLHQASQRESQGRMSLSGSSDEGSEAATTSSEDSEEERSSASDGTADPVSAAAVAAFSPTEALAAAVRVVPDLEATGLFGIVSLFNHSCLPNVSIEFNGIDGSSVDLVATRPVSPGEELCISYIDDEDLDVHQRQKELQEYGFRCECDRCNAERRNRKRSWSRVCECDAGAGSSKRAG